MTYDFEVVEDHSISLGGHIFRLIDQYGIEPSKFMTFCKDLSDEYGLKINEVEFEVPLYLNDETRKGITRPIKEYVDFIIYSNILEQKGVNITNLISQIKPCKDYYEIRHACSLAILTYIYHKNLYKIDFLRKEGDSDFLINNFKADLKTFQPSVLKKPRKNVKLTKSGAVDIGNVIFLDISQKLSSRFVDGVRQAELLYFDFTGSGWFSALGTPIAELNRITSPKKYRLILYNTHFIHHDAQLYHKWGNKEVFLGKMTYPDLHRFKGFPVDFDPYLWSFLSQFQVT